MVGNYSRNRMVKHILEPDPQEITRLVLLRRQLLKDKEACDKRVAAIDYAIKLYQELQKKA